MKEQLSQKYVYLVNKKIFGTASVLIYGVDAGAKYLRDEISKCGMNVLGFYNGCHNKKKQFDNLPVWDEMSIRSIPMVNLVIAKMNGRINTELGKLHSASVFLYSTAYQNDIVWIDNASEDFDINPFYLINDEILKRDIVLYGTGDIGHRLFLEFLNYEIPVKCFCDSNNSVTGLKLMNKPVISLGELIKIKDNCNVVIASRDYAEEIGENLYNHGIRNLYYYNG